jgi:hypothetical protein
MKFGVIAKDKDMNPKHYSVSFSKKDLTVLFSGNPLTQNFDRKGIDTQFYVQVEDSEDPEFEARYNGDDLVFFVRGHYSNKGELAKALLNQPKISIEGDKKGAELSFLPIYCPEAGIDYRVARVDKSSGKERIVFEE